MGSPYPSRLGFFSFKNSRNIFWIDTNRLCSDCCNQLVPKGYTAWSSRWSAVSSATGAETDRGWLERVSSIDSEFMLFESGVTQDFPTRVDFSGPLVTRLRVPADPESAKAWSWIQKEYKPFYIDQLHLAGGWSSFAEMSADRDAAIASKSGLMYQQKLHAAAAKKLPATSITSYQALTQDSMLAAPLSAWTINDQIASSHIRAPAKSEPSKPVNEPLGPVSSLNSSVEADKANSKQAAAFQVSEVKINAPPPQTDRLGFMKTNYSSTSSIKQDPIAEHADKLKAEKRSKPMAAPTATTKIGIVQTARKIPVSRALASGENFTSRKEISKLASMDCIAPPTTIAPLQHSQKPIVCSTAPRTAATSTTSSPKSKTGGSRSAPITPASNSLLNVPQAKSSSAVTSPNKGAFMLAKPQPFSAGPLDWQCKHQLLLTARPLASGPARHGSRARSKPVPFGAPGRMLWWL